MKDNMVETASVVYIWGSLFFQVLKQTFKQTFQTKILAFYLLFIGYGRLFLRGGYRGVGDAAPRQGFL